MEGSSLKSFRKEMGERDKRVRKEGAKHAKSEALWKKMTNKNSTWVQRNGGRKELHPFDKKWEEDHK